MRFQLPSPLTAGDLRHLDGLLGALRAKLCSSPWPETIYDRIPDFLLNPCTISRAQLRRRQIQALIGDVAARRPHTDRQGTDPMAGFRRTAQSSGCVRCVDWIGWHIPGTAFRRRTILRWIEGRLAIRRDKLGKS
jgi:hypothetical protein